MRPMNSLRSTTCLIFAVTWSTGISAAGSVNDSTGTATPIFSDGTNIGIGTTSPGSNLVVERNQTEPAIHIVNAGGAGGAAFEMIDQASGADFKFKSTQSGGFKIRDHANGLDVIQIEHDSSANAIYIDSSGNIGMGTKIPVSKLAVNGQITAKEIEVTNSGWPDYVFDKNYRLMPLEELHRYLSDHQHLPGVPTASTVEESGIGLGETSALLLEKIEELTLYVIDLKKQNDSLKERISVLEKL